MTVVPSEESPHRQTALPLPLPPTAILDWLVYAGIALCSLTAALIGAYNVDADTVAYLDLSNAVRTHHWHALVNASWFPLYPALLTIGRAFFHFRPQFDLMAARLVDSVIELMLVLACVVLAAMLRRLMIARGVASDELLPARTLSLWIAIFSYFLISQDLTGIKPDALVSFFLILAIAALLRGLVQTSLLPFLAVGLCGALAYWGKAFAFPVFILLLLLAAAANLRRPRILLGLLLSLAVFAIVAGPYVWKISAHKGRFTIGDSGRLNTAWYVNGADRFNPVPNFTVYHLGDAQGSFTHPGELLFADPAISYYGRDQVYGSTPQWDDFSYWSDGLRPRLVPRETIAAIARNTLALTLTLAMRLQLLFLVAALLFWRFSLRRQSFVDPILIVLPLLALASIASLTLVHLETRYIAFSFILMGAAFAACSTARPPSRSHNSLHYALVLIAGLMLTYALQNNLREFKQAKRDEASPLDGIYSMPIHSAGTSLASLYPPGTEVACLGDWACWEDPLWVEFAGVKMTAIIETGPGAATKSADQGCGKLEQHLDALDPLRQRHVMAVIGRFDRFIPCSPRWKPLGDSGQFFYLPL